jgi:hypothetical protein
MINARTRMRHVARTVPLTAAALTSALHVSAQTSDAQALRTALDDVVRSIAPRFDCKVSMPGMPIFQELSGTWVAFFMAEGRECEAAVEALSARAKLLEVLLARRPTLAQVGKQIRATLSSVRSGYHCQIMLRGDPTFQNASGDWLVTYMASGSDCDAPAEQLADLGEELQLLFVRNVARQDLIR